MPGIKVGADFNEVIRGTVALNTALGAQGLRLGEVTSQMNTYNSIGKLIRSVTQGMTEDGKKFNAVLKEQQVLVQAAIGKTPAVFKQELLPEKISFTDKKQEIEEVTRKMGLFEKGVNRAASALFYFTTYKAFNFLTNQIEESVSAANKLQIKLSLIRTISQDNQTGASTLQKQVLQSSNRSGFSSEDTATAFYDTVSNQVAKGGDKVKQFVDTASDLARVTGSTLPDAGNTLTSVINAYGKSAEDAERISAVLFRTVDEGRIVLNETAGTLGRAAVLGSNLGVSFEELSATLAITTQKGFKTADAMTLITNLLIKLEKPTEETKKLFDELGVSTGEEAIKLFGFTGVLQKMVDLTKSGKVSASAFFDEIRGRKQFAVFEQSIGDIDKFKNKLDDLSATQAQFNRAKDIRGESNADQVNKQLNEIKNFFTANVGEKILAVANDTLKLGDAFSTTLKSSGLLQAGVEGLVAALGTLALAYTVNKAQIHSTDAALIAQRKEFIANGIALAKFAAIAYAAYQVGKLGVTIGDRLSERIGGKRADQASEEDRGRFLEALRDAQNKEEASRNKGSVGQTVQEFISDQTFKQVLGFYAQLTVSNKKLFDDIKTRSEEAGTSLKVGFSTFGDALKSKISDLKKAVTEARAEIERSQKATLKFGDSIAAAKFALKEKYAEDLIGGLNNQKIELTKQKIKDLSATIEKLYAAGDSNSIAEARALQGPLVQAVLEKKYLEEAVRQRRFDADPSAGEFTTDDVGKAIRVRRVDTTDTDKELDALEQKFKKLEEGVQVEQQKTIKNSKEQIKLEDERLKRFEVASAAYQALTPYDKGGNIKKEFETQGGFDVGKFNAEEARLRANVQKEIFSDKSKIENSGEDYRFKAAETLADFQKVKILELAALERQVFFDNQKAKAQALESQYKEDIKKQQDARKAGSEDQQRAAKSIASSLKFGADLENSQRQALEPLNFLGRKDDLGLSKDAKYLLSEADKKRKEAEAAIVELQRNQTRNAQGGLVTRPEDYIAAKAAAEKYIESLRSLYNLQKAETGQQGLPAVDGVAFTDIEKTLNAEFNRLLSGQGKVGAADATEGLLNNQLKTNVTDPLIKLQSQFPNVAAEAEKAGIRVNAAFDNAANKGIDASIKKIQELQRELENLKGAGAGPKAAADFGGGAFDAFGGVGEVYAASGGVAGLFPGQPRGVDRYPIWAAAGETIVNAETSRMYRPMLEAIMQRRMPRYMAGGGVVGSNTTVGDINVTVQGGQTNDETGRSVAMRLAREARRNNINLFRK